MKGPHRLCWTSPRSLAPALMVAACLSQLACGADPAGPRSGGTYRLVQRNRMSLPIDMGELGRRCPPAPTTPPCDRATQPICHQLMTEGTLSLDADRHRYTFFVLTRNSCGASILSLSHNTGSFEVNGQSLTFRPDGREPRGFRGILDDDAVVVDVYGDKLMRFERSATPAAGLMVGQFNLVGQRVQNLPTSDPAASNPPICPRVVNSGTLTLEPLDGMFPLTGRFRLAHQLTDSCTGRSTTGRDETGTYEQVVNTLVFIASLAPNVVHPFHGSIGVPDIVLHIGGDHDLAFRR